MTVLFCICARAVQDFAARYWVDGGCPPEKINIGMGTYGRCFTLTDPNNHGLDAPAKGPCTTGQYTGEPGFLAYYEASLCLSNY